MTTITIEDSTYFKLQTPAEQRKLSLDEYLNEVARSNVQLNVDATRQLAALESFAAGMKSWTTNHLPPGYVADDSRESIYEDRGE